MFTNYPDKSAKVIRFKIKKHVSEGERRKELNSVTPLGGSSCHLFTAVAAAKPMEIG